MTFFEGMLAGAWLVIVWQLAAVQGRERSMSRQLDLAFRELRLANERIGMLEEQDKR